MNVKLMGEVAYAIGLLNGMKEAEEILQGQTPFLNRVELYNKVKAVLEDCWEELREAK